MSLNQLLQTVLPNFPVVREDAEIDVLQELPVETLYLALKQADAMTAAWFFNNATPEQVQGIVDIDCWSGDNFLPERFTNVFRHLVITHPVKLLQVMKAIDPEVMVRALLEAADVLDFDPQEPPEVEEADLMFSPDSKYALVFKTKNVEMRESVRQWMNKLAMTDIELMRRFLESCKWELASDLEEHAFEMKKGRLEEMGFVDRLEAMSLYSRGTAAELKKKLLADPLPEGTKSHTAKRETDNVGEDDAPRVNEAFLPAPFAGPIFSDGFTARAMREVQNPALRRLLLAEILRVLNGALAADDLLHADIDPIAEGTMRSKHYLDLGLAYLADGKAAEGAKLLETQPLWEVFRLGWLVVQDLVKVSDEITKRYTSALFGAQDAVLMEQLKGRHPELDATSRMDLGLGERPLTSMESVLTVGTRLTALNQIGAFFHKDLGSSLKLEEFPPLPNESGYSRLLAGIFREVSGADFSCVPLKRTEWAALASGFVKREGEEEFRQAMKAVAARCPQGARAHFEKRLTETGEELLAYLKKDAGQSPDPRFFRALVFVEQE